MAVLLGKKIIGIINSDSDFQEVTFKPTNDYKLQLIRTKTTYKLPDITNLTLLISTADDFINIITWKNEALRKDELCIDQVIDKILKLCVFTKPEYSDGILVKYNARLFRIKFSRYINIPNQLDKQLYMCVYKIV